MPFAPSQTAVGFSPLSDALVDPEPTACPQVVPGPTVSGESTCGLAGSPRSVSGGEVEHFGMGPAVVLGQDFAESPGTVRDGAVADLAAGDR